MSIFFAMRARRLSGLDRRLAIAPALEAAGAPPIAEEQITAEIKAVRAARRTAAPVPIVLDTNVVLSALLWRGTPFRLLQAMRERQRLQLFTSPALLSELGEVLARPRSGKQLA